VSPVDVRARAMAALFPVEGVRELAYSKPVPAVAHVANLAAKVTPAGWDDARPEWDDLTRAERDEHRADCSDLCRFCEAHRAFGHCASCGYTREANDAGDCIFCEGPLLLGSDVRDDPKYWSEG
jgi:hypothetical protein